MARRPHEVHTAWSSSPLLCRAATSATRAFASECGRPPPSSALPYTTYRPVRLLMPSHIPVLQRHALEPTLFSWERHLYRQTSPKGNSRTDVSAPCARWYARQTSGPFTLILLMCAAYETGSQQANKSKRVIKASVQQGNTASNTQSYRATWAQMTKAARHPGHRAANRQYPTL